MKKITVEEALLFATKHFPNAPESLVEFLGIDVHESPISCDGWSLQIENRSIIRINSKMPKVRRRFTLAHELGHLIYEIPAVIGENIFDIKNKSDIERKIDDFAAKLLLPESIILDEIEEIPVTAKALRKITRKAKISQPSVALRVASLAPIVGLENAWVLFFENQNLKWQQPIYPKIDKWVSQLLKDTVNSAPNPFRLHYKEDEIVVVSVILENPSQNTTILFLQIINENDGLKELNEERIRNLETKLFSDDLTFRQSINGKLGFFKSKAQNLNIDEASRFFYSRLAKNSGMLSEGNIRRIKSNIGREYVRLRLQIWTKS